MRAPVFLLGLLFSASALADSPLTSIDFHDAYPGEPAVAEAKQGDLERVYAFLAGGASNDRKLAAMTALGWGRPEVPTGFVAFLARTPDLAPERLTASQLTPSQLFALGYLLALAQHLELTPLRPGRHGLLSEKPEALLAQAARAQKQDFTVQYAWALVRAQAAMADQKTWCRVFSLPRGVERAFPPAKRNLKPAALSLAHAYLDEYEASCPGSRSAATQKLAERNQLYSVTLVGAHVLAGAQAGVVVWDITDATTPKAMHDGFICRGLVVDSTAWHGCEREVVRWDGARFKRYLPRTKNPGATYYEPMLGPDGALWVRLGAQTWRYDAASDSFKVLKAPWKRAPAAAIFFDGQPWTIDFMAGLTRGAQDLALASADYPAKDPRNFSVDATGALWVEDFGAGLLRWDGARFVQQPGLRDKGTGVAVDRARGLRLLLHYTDGLLVQREGRPDAWVDLKSAEYLRGLAYDADTGELWVASEKGLLQLRPDGDGWSRRSWQVR